MKKILFISLAIFLVAAGCNSRNSIVNQNNAQTPEMQSQTSNDSNQNLQSNTDNTSTQGNPVQQKSQPNKSTTVKPNPSDQEGEISCAQVITHARNTTTGEERDFPNACIPEGWVATQPNLIQ